MDNTTRFDGHAESYAKGRPSYPEELIARLAEWAELTQESSVADIGAGTGIFSDQLAHTGAHVFAVEPNAGMRQRASLSNDTSQHVTWIDGTAEQTSLPDSSVNLVTAAQAFHWFDGPSFRAECLRILRKPVRVALVWNVRVLDAPVNLACEEVFRAFCPRFKGFAGGMTRHDQRIVDFFGGSYDLWCFDNPLSYSEEKFVQRCLSGSYAPREDEADHEPFKAAVGELFERYRMGGSIVIPNETLAYVGTLDATC